jgi:hypothetical protein
MKKTVTNRSKELNHDDSISNLNDSGTDRRTDEVGSLDGENSWPRIHAQDVTSTPHSRNTIMATSTTSKFSRDIAEKFIAAVPELSRLDWTTAPCDAFVETVDQQQRIDKRKLNKAIKSALPSYRSQQYMDGTPINNSLDYEANIDGHWVSFQYCPYPEAKGSLQVSCLYTD